MNIPMSIQAGALQVLPAATDYTAIFISSFLSILGTLAAASFGFFLSEKRRKAVDAQNELDELVGNIRYVQGVLFAQANSLGMFAVAVTESGNGILEERAKPGLFSQLKPIDVDFLHISRLLCNLPNLTIECSSVAEGVYSLNHSIQCNNDYWLSPEFLKKQPVDLKGTYKRHYLLLEQTLGCLEHLSQYQAELLDDGERLIVSKLNLASSEDIPAEYGLLKEVPSDLKQCISNAVKLREKLFEVMQ